MPILAFSALKRQYKFSFSLLEIRDFPEGFSLSCTAGYVRRQGESLPGIGRVRIYLEAVQSMH
jgi:hypothetical protein